MTESPDLESPPLEPSSVDAPPIEPPPQSVAPISRVWGLLLVAGGVLLLLERAFPALSSALGTIALLGGGVAFLWLWRRSPDDWWPLIPGLAMLALGLTAALGWLAPDRWVDALDGSLLFVGIGSAFLTVYLRDRENWWAVIPAGALWGCWCWLASGCFLRSDRAT